MPEGTATISRPGAKGVKGLVKDKRVLYVGGAVVGGAVAYAWWTKGQGGEEPEPLFDEFGNPIAGPTPGLTEPNVLDSNLTTTVGTGLSTNAAWTQAATDYLEGRGYNAQAILAAINKFLQRKPLSPVEAELVGVAVATQGWPPEGRPWTIIATAPTTPPAPVVGLPPAPSSVRATGGRVRLDASWSGVTGATGYQVRYVRGYPQGVGGPWVTKPATARSHHFVLRVTRDTKFTVEVRARNQTGYGPSKRSGPATVAN